MFRDASDTCTLLVCLRPANERTFWDWSNDPFACDNHYGGNLTGTTERYPGAWLLAFWMARHHGLIQPLAE